MPIRGSLNFSCKCSSCLPTRFAFDYLFAGAIVSLYLMADKFIYNRRVEFRDTDMAGIVHFSVFHAYMEEAEHALLRSLGLGVICEIEGQRISFPRVNASCDYRKPIKFEEQIEIEVTIAKIGNSSLTFNHHFKRDGETVAEGSITVVCCEFDHGPRPKSCPIPKSFREKIQPFVVEPNSE